MKHVFSNSKEVAHIWAQNEAGRDGRNGTDNSSFRATNGRQTLYSYSEPIAWFLTGQIVVVNSHNFSPTTNGHLCDARRAVSHKTVFEINGAQPSDTPEELAKKAIEQVVKALVPIADRSIRAVGKVRWELGNIYLLIGYCGLLAAKDKKYSSAIHTQLDRLVDSGLNAAMDVLGGIVRDEHKPQISQDQAGKLMQAIVEYHQHVDAGNATERYLAVMKHAREHFNEDKVGGVLYLERYATGCNRQLQDKLSKAQVKRLLALYADLRKQAAGEAVQLLDVRNERGSDWRHGMYVLKTFKPDLDPQVYSDRLVQVTQCKYDVLSAELEGIAADGKRFGPGHGRRLLDKWRAEANGDQVLLVLAAKAEAALVQQEQERLAQLVAKQAEYIALWRAKKEDSYEGDRVSRFDLPTMIRLRAKGKVIETSHGARVPAGVAAQLWELVKLAKAGDMRAANAWTNFNVGEYTLNKVERDGSLIIGCHTLSYDELALMAQQLSLNSDSQGEMA